METSTAERPWFDYAAPERRLLMAVITRAIEDCCQPLARSEARAQKNRAYEPIQALRWLLAPNPVLAWYCDMLGLDAKILQSSLIKAMWDVTANTVALNAEQRRLFRLRLNWARRDGILTGPYDIFQEAQRDQERLKDGSEDGP